jgi:hypothetical protein
MLLRRVSYSLNHRNAYLSVTHEVTSSDRCQQYPEVAFILFNRQHALHRLPER